MAFPYQTEGTTSLAVSLSLFARTYVLRGGGFVSDAVAVTPGTPQT